MFCFDTDVISAAIKSAPPLALVRRLTRTPVKEQCTTAITLAELLYGAARVGRPRLAEHAGMVVGSMHAILHFDERAARTYGTLRAELEQSGTRLDDPDLRIAAIALARDLTLVTGNVRHFARVPGLRIENWLEPEPIV